MQRDHEFDACLLLLHANGAVANMLRPHAEHVAASLSGVKQEGKRQSRAGTPRMILLELRDLAFGPGMVAPRFDADRPHFAGRIIGA